MITNIEMHLKGGLMKRRFVAMCSVLFIVGSVLLAGCGSKTQEGDVLTVWHWMTDRQEAFEFLARRYEEETGVKVRVDLYAPSDAYTQRIVASAQANVLPDVYGILDKKEIFASFIESDFVADLTDEFAKEGGAWEKSLFEKALDVNRFKDDNIFGVKPGIYGVPLDVTNIQMLYNKKLLQKAGIMEPPRTFEELLAAIVALKRVGVEGLVSGWGELWMADAFASNYAFNIMGEEKIMATYRGEVPYTDPDWIKVLEVFQQLADQGALSEGIVTKQNKYAEQDFALERAAFAFNGSWCVNVYHDMNPNLEYGAMLPPVVNKRLPMRIWGGAGSSLVVNARSPRKQQAIDFLKWLTAKEQQAYLAKETRNLPSNRQALDDIPQILSDFAKVMDNTTHPTVWALNEHALVTEKFNRGIQSIIIGEKTPAQVAQEVQAVKQRELSKSK